MAGYQPERPRPTDAVSPNGLPGDPVQQAVPAAVSAPVEPERVADDPPAGPTRRVVPRPAPPMDRRLPGTAVALGCAAVLIVLLWWRPGRRR